MCQLRTHNIIFACFALYNFCKVDDIEVDNTVVDQINSDELCTHLKIDRINTYTTTAGSKV